MILDGYRFLCSKDSITSFRKQENRMGHFPTLPEPLVFLISLSFCKYKHKDIKRGMVTVLMPYSHVLMEG